MWSPSSSSVSSVSPSVRKRKAVEQEELNTKTFRMSDLIAWKPKEENKLQKKWNDKKKELRERESAEEPSSSQQPSSSHEKPPVAAPRVKLNEKGEIILDTESLVIIEKPDDNDWTTINEDLVPKKLNSLSFKKNPSVRSHGWSSEETDLFYYVLASTGPDFGLMHDFMPTRTRAELKKKFKKEERLNMLRINETLKKPAMLDEKSKLRAKEMLEKIEGEKQAALEKVEGEKPVLEKADDEKQVSEKIEGEKPVLG